MINVVGVRFQNTGKSYYFDPVELELKRGMHVIVETQRGREYGTITIPPILVQDDKVVQPLRPIIRIATEEDEQRNAENKEKSAEAGKICVEKIAKYGLEMKLVETEYTFDRSKLLFYFTADGRVDFRELVKDLASVFRTRIELRQIGVRDETKIKGGLGMCGRELCCTTFLSDFAPVSIRMAKEQNLSLNPTKISGACGRLMCCLKNEQETYEYLNKQLPKVGQRVNTIDQIEGTVQSVNILKQTAKVVLDLDGDKEIREYAAGEMAYGDRDFTCEPRRRQEDELDYFSEQLKLAVAAKDLNGENEEKEEHGRNRSRNNKNRSRQGTGGRSSKQSADRSQQADVQKNADRKSGAQKHGNVRQTGASGQQQNEQKASAVRRQRDGQKKREEQQESGQKQRGTEKRRRNDRRQNRPAADGAKEINEVKTADARKNDGQKNANMKQHAGRTLTGPQKQDGAQSRDGTEKNTRNRSRNRHRSNKKREGNRTGSDTAGTKQSAETGHSEETGSPAGAQRSDS